jgi:hypothetical protein
MRCLDKALFPLQIYLVVLLTISLKEQNPICKSRSCSATQKLSASKGKRSLLVFTAVRYVIGKYLKVIHIYLNFEYRTNISICL